MGLRSGADERRARFRPEATNTAPGQNTKPGRHRPAGPCIERNPRPIGENSAGSAGILQKIGPPAAQGRDIAPGFAYSAAPRPLGDGPKSREDNGLSSPRSSAAGAISRA